jgi:hypothetical protein
MIVDVMTPPSSPSPVSKTDWANLPLGEDRSYLCGGRNKFGLTPFEEALAERGDDGYPQGTPTPADERRMELE